MKEQSRLLMVSTHASMAIQSTLDFLPAQIQGLSFRPYWMNLTTTHQMMAAY